MEELQDYSGEFKADLKLQDLSKDALIRLWECGAKLYIVTFGLWDKLIREKCGEDKVGELDHELWFRKGGIVELEMLFSRQAMNIWGDDVASVFKCFQIDPGMAGIMELKYELKNKNHGILTVERCRTLEYFERHNETTLLKHTCHGLEVKAYQRVAELFNPKMKAIPLKLPPRKNKEEIACQWEYRIEEEAQTRRD